MVNTSSKIETGCHVVAKDMLLCGYYIKYVLLDKLKNRIHVRQAFYNNMGVAILRSKANNPFNIKQRSYSTSEESISSASSDKRLNKKPIIDVWWLSDDGGLTLLVPYLLTQQGSRLKVMFN
ncbi:hypothetical protein COOONC_25965 [Cooperia oncophora]